MHHGPQLVPLTGQGATPDFHASSIAFSAALSPARNSPQETYGAHGGIPKHHKDGCARQVSPRGAAADGRFTRTSLRRARSTAPVRACDKKNCPGGHPTAICSWLLIPATAASVAGGGAGRSSVHTRFFEAAYVPVRLRPALPQNGCRLEPHQPWLNQEIKNFSCWWTMDGRKPNIGAKHRPPAWRRRRTSSPCAPRGPLG